MTADGFRFAGRDDGEVVVALVQSAYRGDPSREGWTTEADLIEGQRVDGDMVAEALADPTRRVLLLEEDGTVVACCELQRCDDGSGASLGMFAVDPRRQAGGSGRRVLAEAERVVADEWGVDRLRLQVLEPRGELIGWYGRRGYHPTGAIEPFPYGDERFGRPRRPDLRFVVLEKRLG